MVGLINLPGYEIPRNALLDTSGINNAIDSNRQNALMQQKIGLQERQVNLQEATGAREQKQFDAQQREAQGLRIAGRFQYLDGLPADQREAQWQQIRASDPDFKGMPPNMTDYSTARNASIAHVTRFMPDLERRLKEAQASKLEAEAKEHGANASGGGKRSLVPVYGTDANGNTVLLQTGPRGDAVQTQLPQGVSVAQGVDKVDMGDRYALINKRDGSVAGYLPKNVAEAASQKKQGEAQGQAQIDLPKVRELVSRVTGQIEAVEKDPNLSSVTGWQSYFPTISSKSHDTEARIEQLQGAGFLKAFESIKGAGAISNAEGAKAEQAASRLGKLKQSDGGYREALADFKRELIALQDLAESRANPQRGATSGPVVGERVQKEFTGRLPQGWSIQRVD